MRAVPVKIATDTYSADEFNELMSQELQNAVLDSGQTLTKFDLTQLGKAFAIYSAGGDFYTDGGSANTYTLSVIGPKQYPPHLFKGMKVSFIAGNTNTGASTVTPPGLGPVAIEYNGSALVANKIVSGEIIELVFNNATFRFDLINSISSIDDQATTNQVNLTDTGVEFPVGIKVGGTGASNLIEETDSGTWVPWENNIAFASANGSFTLVGDKVDITAKVTLPVTGVNSNLLELRGLPFAPKAGNDFEATFTVTTDKVGSAGYSGLLDATPSLIGIVDLDVVLERIDTFSGDTLWVSGHYIRA